MYVLALIPNDEERGSIRGILYIKTSSDSNTLSHINLFQKVLDKESQKKGISKEGKA